jgi:transaldolase
MEIFIDSANLADIRRWLEYGLIDGVTTNPSILLKDGGYDMETRVKEVATLVAPRPVSVEVTTNDRREMLEQARTLAELAPNIVIKIPVINEYGEPCLGVVRTLESESIKVNMTACMSFGQVALGAKVRATYISIFAGRVADEGHDSPRLIRQSVDWLKEWNYPSKLIIGSIREVINIQDAALAGAHVITVPPEFIGKLVDHKYTRDTVRGFLRDAQAALAKVQELALQGGRR